MNSIDARELERTRYWQGQMLRSGDLRQQVATDAQLRWWHNRAVHSAFGVTLGLRAWLMKRDTGAIAVEPGVAYDRFGRALILRVQRAFPLPAQLPGKTLVTLVIRYREIRPFPARQDSSGVCLECGGTQAMDEVDLAWIPSATLTLDDGVPLARIMGPRSNPKADPEFSVLKGHALTRPYLVNGSTVAGGTEWTVQRVSRSVLAFDTVIDTTAAGFTRTPCYLAWLEDGAKLSVRASVTVEPGVANTADAKAGASSTGTFKQYLSHIKAPGSTGFAFRVLAPLDPLDLRKIGRSIGPVPVRSDAYVCWLGCQSTRDDSRFLDPRVQKPCCC